MSRSVTEPVTLGLLLSALLCALVGAFTARAGATQIQDVVQTLAILAAATGIYANRWATANERRDLALHALAEELRHNEKMLESEDFEPMGDAEPARVYPRVVLSAVNATMASSALDPRRDLGLMNDLHRWRNAAHALNRRLDLAEIIAFVSASVPVTASELDLGLHQPEGHLERAQATLERARSHIPSVSH